MKSTRGQSFKGVMQKGFTLVELAIVLVIAGIILVGVLKGTDSINKAKVERAVADLKGLQGTLLEFQKRTNRLPGDCNNDGIIALSPPIAAQILNTVTSAVGSIPDSTQRDANSVGICGTAGNVVDISQNDEPKTETPGASAVPAVSSGSGNYNSAVSNLVYDELRRAGVVDGNRTNLELAKHLQQDIFLVGAMQDAATATVRANVIVMYGIPVWLAEAIDAEIDGVAQDYSSTGAAGPAATGRVRLWSSNMTAGTGTPPANLPVFAATSGQYGSDRDALVSISFQFDTTKLPK